MDVPKRLHMSVSTLPYVDVPTHLHTFVLERRGRSETPSDNCFYTPRIWPRHISSIWSTSGLIPAQVRPLLERCPKYNGSRV